MRLDKPILQKIARALARTRPEEIGCDACFEEMDRFAEMVMAGKPAAEMMPLVQDHLDRCSDCREEFEVLMDVLRAES